MFLTDSWVAGVVDAPEASAALPQAGPLMASVIHTGPTPTGGAEAVPAVPCQHGPGLGHNT